MNSKHSYRQKSPEDKSISYKRDSIVQDKVLINRKKCNEKSTVLPIIYFVNLLKTHLFLRVSVSSQRNQEVGPMNSACFLQVLKSAMLIVLDDTSVGKIRSRRRKNSTCKCSANMSAEGMVFCKFPLVAGYEVIQPLL